ncbi:MAG: hypothetical protein WD872_01160 [Pirellulaceae bacterium]
MWNQVQHVGARSAVLDLFVECGHIDRPEAAVAGYDGGRSLHQVVGILASLGLGDRFVAVRMQVDESRRHDQPLGIDDACARHHFELAQGDNAVPLDGNVAHDWFGVAAVVDRAATEHQVGLDRIGSQQREEQQRSEIEHVVFQARICKASAVVDATRLLRIV